MNTVVSYEIDADDIITAVGDDWDRFALENNAGELTGSAVIGSRIFDFISEENTRDIFRNIFDRIRAKSGTLRLPFRCDADEIRRFIDMTIFAGTGGHLHFRTQVMKTESRPAIRLPLDPPGEPEESIVMCSWCKQVRLSPELWVELEDAVQILKPFERDGRFGVVHSICHGCSDRLKQASSGE